MFPALTEIPQNLPAAQHGQRLDHFLRNQQEIIQELQDLSDGVQRLNNANHRREERMAFQEKIHGIQSSCTFLKDFANATSNSTLHTAATTGFAVTQMYSGGAALLSMSLGLASLNPIAMAATGALTLFQTFAKKRNRGEGNVMETFFRHMQALSQQVFNMHQDTHDLFEINFENQNALLEAMINGFNHLEKTILTDIQRVGAIAEQRFDRIEATINRIGRILADGQEMISLQKFGDVLSQAQALIDGTEVQNQEAKCEKVARKLTDWLKLNGRSALSLHTGARWVPRGLPADYHNSIIEVLREVSGNTVGDLLGFLAFYAHYHLGVNFADNVENTESLILAVFNPNLWVAACERYIELRQELSRNIPDPANSNINRIIEAANSQISFIQALRRAPSLFDALFTQYQNGINELNAVINTAIAAQNAALPNGINFSMDIGTLFTQCHAKKPKNTMLIGGILTCDLGNKQLPNIDSAAAGIDFAYPYISCVIAPFILLEDLGLGSVALRYRVSAPPKNCSIASSIYNITIEIVAVTPEAANVILTINRTLHIDVHYPYQIPTLLHTQLGVHSPTSIIPVANIIELQQQVIAKLQTFFLAHRKAAIQQINGQGTYAAPFNQALAKIDANLQLLKAYCLAAGFQTAELQILCMAGQHPDALLDSHQIRLQIQNYIAYASYDTPLPLFHLPQLASTQALIVDKTRTPTNLDYFQDTIHVNKLSALVTELNLLANINLLLASAEVNTTRNQSEERQAVTIHIANYQAGLEAGDEIALSFIIRALQGANFTNAANSISQNHPDILERSNGRLNPSLTQGIIQGLSNKVMEISDQLMDEGDIAAGRWLLRHARLQIRQLIESDQSLNRISLTENPSLPITSHQGTGLTMFDNSTSRITATPVLPYSNAIQY